MSESFGTGIGYNPLPPGTTNYTYSNTYPLDGYYTVSNGTFGNLFDWHEIEDHTPGDTNGKCLVVNADTAPGGFYGTVISGLCPNTTYEFSAWLINLVKAGGFCSTQPGGTIPVNVSFEIWDASDTFPLAAGTTGNILESVTPNWQEYGLVFQTLAGQNTVILKMINNSTGGCGNDLAIDDIEVKSCGDTTTVTDATSNSSINVCSGLTPFSMELTATPDFSVYTSHFYQWQESSNGSLWSDIMGGTSQSITISVTSTGYYRAKIAETASNLDNSQCISFSNVFQATIIPSPSIPTLECWETATVNDTTCTWVVSGSQPLQPNLECYETATFNNTTCSWEITGTQPAQPALECWETATYNTATCSWDVTGTQPAQPAIECWETATFNDTTCVWEVSGSQTQQPNIACYETATYNTATCIWDITGTQPAQPAIECWETATFNDTTCVWEVSGSPTQQPNIACYETATFNTTSCSWEITGAQPEQPVLEEWETAVFNTTTCIWDVSGTQAVVITEEYLNLCDDSELVLFAHTELENPDYAWNTGATTEEITIDTPGVYTVDITDGMDSFQTIIYNVVNPETPIIESVESNGDSIIITTTNSGDFSYSLDGIIFQSNSTFYALEIGWYTIYVKDQDCGSMVSLNHFHLDIPKFFTPNNDGINDTFNLLGIENYSTSQVAIFDRYGKLLKFTSNNSFEWDGTYSNQNMPSDDYWYSIFIEGQKITGHITLKR